MRVISGKCKRMLLRVPSGMHTRPTTDRIKETLFNILQHDIPDSIFLDLFSGSGGIGIEALSRGAKEAVFVDDNKEAVRCIKENLTHTGLTNQGVVMKIDAVNALKRLEKSDYRFDIIFMDPPYENNIMQNMLQILQISRSVKENTMIIMEASLNTSVQNLERLGFSIIRVKEYKTNQHIFMKVSC